MADDATCSEGPAIIRHADPHHARVVLVDWMLGNSCSYACSYCPTNLHDGSIRWQPGREVLRFLDVLGEHYGETMGRRVHIQFTGGEPTMHPDIVELLSAATDRGLSVSLISNASRTIRFWERLQDRLDAAILTYHDEFADHAHFLRVARLLADRMPLHVNVTVHPERFDATLGRAEDIGRTVPEASISLKPLRLGFGSEMYPYTEEQRRRLERSVTRPGARDVATPRGMMTSLDRDGAWENVRANEFILRRQNRWRGYLCEAGLESLRVHADGRILRSVCGVGGLVGRLGERVELPVSPILCDRDACNCVADILITKRRMDGLSEAAETLP